MNEGYILFVVNRQLVTQYAKYQFMHNIIGKFIAWSGKFHANEFSMRDFNLGVFKMKSNKEVYFLV